VDQDPKVKAVDVPSRFMVKCNEIASHQEKPRDLIGKKWEEYRKKMIPSSQPPLHAPSSAKDVSPTGLF
jgi:hypothetical protein